MCSAMHGNRAGLVLALRAALCLGVSLSLLLYFSLGLVDAKTSIILSLTYLAVLCALLYLTRKSMWPELVAFYLLVAWLAIAAIINSRTPPVTLRGVNGWLKREVPPNADRRVILAFVARHDASHTTQSYSDGSSNYIVVTYTNSILVDYCGSVEIIFELNRANRLVSYEVDEVQNCS